MALQIRPQSASTIERGTLGLWTGYFYTINSIVGAGFLSIPWAYDNSGWLFSFLFQIFTIIQSLIFSFQMLQIMSKVQVLTRQRDQGYTVPYISLKSFFESEQSLIPKTQHKPTITDRRLDISECVRSIFGNKAAIIYLFLLFFYMQGIQLAYASVFSTSFASNIPLGTEETCDLYKQEGFYNDCKWKYWVWLAFYSVCMVYLTLKGITEQVLMQSIMTFMRFLVMIVVILCCFVNIVDHRTIDDDDYHQADWPPLFNFYKIGRGIPIILIATLYQQNIPTISEHVRNRKKNLKLMTFFATMTTFVFYSLLGLIVPPGVDGVSSMSTLSFRDYSAGFSEDQRPWWTYIIEYFVVVFPALDVFSAFPLVALATADNITTLIFGYDKVEEVSRKGIYGIRLLVCLPPLFLAVFVYDLGEILDWSGLMGFVLVPIFMPVMHIAANQLVKEKSPYQVLPSNIVRFIQVSDLCFSVINTIIVLFVIVLNSELLEH